MIGKVTCALILLFAFCGAEESVDVKDDIAAAQAKVKAMSETSVKNVQEVNGNLAEITKFFEVSLSKYLTESDSIANTTVDELAVLTNKFVGEAIDKNRPVNTFKCLVKVNGETQNQILGGRDSTTNCINGVFSRNNGDLSDLRTQLDLIQKATTGLYDVVYSKLANCTTSGAVAHLVQEAEVRENNLRKLVRVYTERATDLRIQFNDGQLSCIRTAHQFADNILKICANRMKGC